MSGTVDDCSATWTALIDCLKKRTRFKEEVTSVVARLRVCWAGRC